MGFLPHMSRRINQSKNCLELSGVRMASLFFRWKKPVTFTRRTNIYAFGRGVYCLRLIHYTQIHSVEVSSIHRRNRTLPLQSGQCRKTRERRSSIHSTDSFAARSSRILCHSAPFHSIPSRDLCFGVHSFVPRIALACNFNSRCEFSPQVRESNGQSTAFVLRK